MDDPITLNGGVQIPLREIAVRSSRSSGPGGQHANSTSSRIVAVFDVSASTALSDDQKLRIISRGGPRVVAVAQDTRTQGQNRELALQRLQERLEMLLRVEPPRAATRPTKASLQRRRQAKLHQAARKRGRRPPTPDES